MIDYLEKLIEEGNIYGALLILIGIELIALYILWNALV